LDNRSLSVPAGAAKTQRLPGSQNGSPPSGASGLFSHPAAPYVVPFAVFFFLLGLGPYLEFLGHWEAAGRVAILALIIYVFSRRVLDFRVQKPFWSTLVGVGVFAIWIAPDVLITGYRNHWLLQNQITGQIASSIPEDLRSSAFVQFFRSARAVIIVPIVEELFWRAWLMRWLVNNDFQRVPLGAYTPTAFWVTAVLFASEHGPFWDVGLAAGVIYNWWMIRTRRLGDCMLAHAVTNACLCLYVVITGEWEYWL
jgi:CAAX prenyl protease-like protein